MAFYYSRAPYYILSLVVEVQTLFASLFSRTRLAGGQAILGLLQNKDGYHYPSGVEHDERLASVGSLDGYHCLRATFLSMNCHNTLRTCS